MAQFDQVGSPYSIVMTTPAITITDLMDASFEFNPEMHDHFNGNSRFPRFTMGNDDSTIKFKTSDIAAIAALTKGMEVAGVVLLFKATFSKVDDTAPTLTQGSVEVSAVISIMRVTDAVPIKNDSDKKPAEFEFTLRPAKAEADDADPTIAYSFAAAVV